jgi:hypothetical protein
MGRGLPFISYLHSPQLIHKTGFKVRGMHARENNIAVGCNIEWDGSTVRSVYAPV